MRMMTRVVASGMLLWLSTAARSAPADRVPPVAAHDSGVRYHAATWQCQSGHKVEKRQVILDSGTARYALGYSGCVDPSHGDERPSAEGNFGMPEPVRGNWYSGGFMRILINGVDATKRPVEDWRVMESGARGGFQVVFAHPDAEVCLRMMMLSEGNHLLAQLMWKPRADATIDTVAVELRCYPSFFTTARNRNGDRHCRTPRTDAPQGETLQIVPGEDTYLYYYDTVFDVEAGEGDGPCAALVPPEGLEGGEVVVGSYAVMTTLNYRPAAGQARLGLYDFTGWTNARAGSYLDDAAAADLAELTDADFRPLAAQSLDLEALRAEANRLLRDAGEDGVPLEAQIQDLLTRVAALKTEADAGSWQAEADLGAEIEGSADLFWKLRAFAILNSPGP